MALPYREIRAFYDAELARRGWTFYEEEQMKDWGRDLGGKSARYMLVVVRGQSPQNDAATLIAEAKSLWKKNDLEHALATISRAISADQRNLNSWNGP